ncbi:MAG TPA: YjjG family noncanonical pyrimidine nucleotidase [Prolixibacteraceae bacterium]|nr:YjjG family noncanonical pyrimidine nucleotidase [Prolixibacteraceae bacterium]
MNKYKHLFFDLDNTLYDFERNSYLALKIAFSKIGIMKQLDSFDEYFDVYTKINELLWAEYREKRIAKDLLRGKRHIDSLAHFGIVPKLEATQIDDVYLSEMASQTELFPYAVEVLSELKNRGYTLHIITNGFKEVQHDKLLNTGLIKFLTNVYISEEIKAPKPSREIFEYAIKSSNARKKESLMIGDSWESDIIGAKKFGIDQVFFKLSDQEIDFGNMGVPTFTITKLDELLNIL